MKKRTYNEKNDSKSSAKEVVSMRVVVFSLYPMASEDKNKNENANFLESPIIYLSFITHFLPVQNFMLKFFV